MLVRALVVAVAVTLGNSVAQQVLVRENLDARDARWVRGECEAGAAEFVRKGGGHIDVGPCPVSSDTAFTLRCRLRTQDARFCTPLMARNGEAVGLSLVMGRKPGRISFEAWSWGSVRVLSRVRVDDNKWHEIEVSYHPASNAAILFVDGEYQAHGILGEGASPKAQLRLGNNIGAKQPFFGGIDEVEVVVAATRAELHKRVTPVLKPGEAAQALAQLRERALRRETPSLAEDARNDWDKRRVQVREHVADALGLSPLPERQDQSVRIEGELSRDGVRLQRITWIAWPGLRASGWLWLPDPLPPGRRPAVLCPHGHWQGGATHPVVQARCAAFARFGWTALAVDSVHVEDIATGVNSVGAMTWHNIRALDLLLAREDVDPERVAVTGASGGGQQSYYLMALEDRLAAAAPVVMACYLTEIISDTSAHCGCNHVPRLAASTDVPEMCAVFAPRPAMFGSVTGDWTKNFPAQGLPELRAHWRRAGAVVPRSRHGDEGHNYDQSMREAVYSFLHDVFDGELRRGKEIAEAEFRPFDFEELKALGPARMQNQLPQTAMANEARARRAKVDSLQALAPGLKLNVDAAKVTWLDGDDAEWRRGKVVGPDGVAIPLKLHGGGVDGDAWTLRLHPHGMFEAALTGQESAGKQAARTVVCDPRPYGEWARFRSAWKRNGIILGRGEGYQAAVDVALVVASLPGEDPVYIVADGETGVVALLAAHICSRVKKVTAPDLGVAYARNGNRLPLCPELLRFRDLPELITTLPKGCVFAK